MLEGGLKLNLNRLIRRGFADRRGVVMVLWHTTGSPTGGEHRLIALSEVDTAFDEKAVKELGRAAKLPTGADIARFGENIRIAARLYLEGKSRLNAPRLREKIERLYQLNKRAERGSDQAARALARGVEIMDDDVRRWLDSCNAGRCREIPTPAEILSPETRQSAIKRFRLILSFGGDVGPGRKRAGGRRSRSFTPHLRVPAGQEAWPSARAGGGFRLVAGGRLPGGDGEGATIHGEHRCDGPIRSICL